VDRERDLEVDRLLGPQRAVVVEGGDALGDRHEVRRAVTRHTGDEIGYRTLRSAVIPRGQGARCLRLGATRADRCENKRRQQGASAQGASHVEHSNLPPPWERSLVAGPAVHAQDGAIERHHRPAPTVASSKCCMIWSTLKLDGLCRGGNSLN